MDRPRKRKFTETNPQNPPKLVKPTKTPDKRRKLQDAREISAQTAENAFQQGHFDPVAFVHSREYEINSLLRSMNNSRNTQRKRAFQSLPRELRRRTAAHNPNRVPKRLRATAQNELADDNTAISKKRRDYRPQVRRLNATQLQSLSRKILIIKDKTCRYKPSKEAVGTFSRITSKSSRYHKRQRHKTWLPTHIWCAKRARMTLKWGFVLAETPNLKCYRPTYRAATREGCVAFDTSYYATILLEGQQNDLKHLLARFLPPRDLAFTGKNVLSGISISRTWIYEPGQWPVGAISPVQISWYPVQMPDKGKNEAVEKVALRVHPSSWEDVWRLVTACTTSSSCTAQDARFDVGSIGLSGPRAMTVLVSLLRNRLTASNSNFSKLPAGGVVHGVVEDPRLHSFHLRTAIPSTPSRETGAAETAGSLFNTVFRNTSVKAQTSRRALNSKISKFISGESLELIPTARIPFVLMRESIGECGRPCNTGIQAPSYDHWTILLPWKWIRSFWLVLVRVAGVRLGGLKELSQLALEAGAGQFPADFPSTKAGQIEMSQSFRERQNMTNCRNTMKSKVSGKKGLLEFEDNSSIPWGTVLQSGRTQSNPPRNGQKVWQLAPDVVHLFWRTPVHVLPHSVCSGIFTAHIRVLGRGNLDTSACIYSISGALARELPHLLTQYKLDGKPVADVLETLEVEAKIKIGDSEETNQRQLAGFVLRGNFGFSEGAPVAIAALAWEKVYKDRLDDEKNGCQGWCLLRNRQDGVRRLAKWSAI